MDDTDWMNAANAMHAADEALEPSPEFAARVMKAVRREAMQPPPIPFPWRRVAIGAAIGIATSAALAASPAVTTHTQAALTEIGSWWDAIDPLFLALSTGVLALTLGVVQLTLWLTSRGA